MVNKSKKSMRRKVYNELLLWKEKYSNKEAPLPGDLRPDVSTTVTPVTIEKPDQPRDQQRGRTCLQRPVQRLRGR